MNNADLDKEVKRLVHSNRYEKGLVCAVDILIQLDYLTKKDWNKVIHIAVGFSGIVVLNYFWYSYANRFNFEHGTNYFFIRTAPAWEMTNETFRELADIIYRIRVTEYYNGDMFILPAVLILLGLFIRKANLWNMLFLISVFTGSLLYLFMFFQQFRYHDYYMINPVIIIPLLYLIGYSIFNKMDYSPPKALIQIILILVLAQSSMISKGIVNFRYQSPDANFFLGKGYGEIDSYLEEIGVDREDFVISLPDESPNISLYLMNRKGWTNLYHNNIEEGDITYFIKAGAKYLIIGDEKLLDDPVIGKFTQNQVGYYKGIRIFRL